ncbi:hypothetical protein GCM10010472_07180 [Pseudonocardia halophobica]|uniref:DUF4352 domain-containing protein n=1 Tax=Pseudonocardia halophobica TaxID=29401 RepID=A0A9W6LAT6_9PSEU|nr:DUF4190 domain-containing protein [Pseudonocardia halophobica]GLL14765.1 hypothetical protein GCM10017577_59130 [Pseudonocardia halophobica]
MTTSSQPPQGGQPQYPGPYGPPQQYGQYPQYGQYGAPQQPWAQVPQQYAPVPPSAPQPRNGLGTAGFVLGLLALLFAWIPFVGVIGWPLSILGLILSGFGLQRVTSGKADNKGLSVAGIALSAIALLVCILWATAFASAVSETSTSSGTVSGAAPTAAAGAPAAAQTVSFGQTYTYKDGLAVTIAAPADFTPSRFAAPQNVDRAVLLTVTVQNGTTQNYDVNTFGNGPNVTFDGAKAEEITDLDQLQLAESATVLPGKSYTYEKAFAVGSGTGELQAEWTREVFSDPVIFMGRA